MISVRFGVGTTIYVEEHAQVVPFIRAVEAWIEGRADAWKYGVARPAPGRWPPPYDVEYHREGE